jgi:hypothetical protein
MLSYYCDFFEVYHFIDTSGGIKFRHNSHKLNCTQIQHIYGWKTWLQKMARIDINRLTEHREL